jgi:hypothetical protein
MLNAIKKWFSNTPPGAWGEVEAWSRSRGYEFKRSRDADGFVVEGGWGKNMWRLEWGPSHRPYINGQELRLRAEIGAGDFQMVVLSRQLMEAMEKAVFESFTEDLQTRADSNTPEEMRWLVLFPKLPPAELKSLREDFRGASSVPARLISWLEGPLAQKLEHARSTWLAAEDPLALILHRGRVVLRTALPQPDLARLDGAISLFEVALIQARRVTREAAEGDAEQAAGLDR